MATSPPASPGNLPQRPLSAIVRPGPRSNSRMSTNSKIGGSRASDEDSRTSVRVVVRVRPPLRPTDPGFELIPQRFQRSMAQVTSNTSLSIESPQGKKVFVFDRVFSPEVMQDGIWDYLSDCVNAFLQGYNVSLLAYGQSGAGKSYTMGTSGPAEQHDVETMGVIPRAANALFEKLDTTSKPNKANRSSMSQLRTPARYSAQGALSGDKSWSLKATYVEIYNEQLRDLLLPESVQGQERSTVTIREDVKGNILLTGLRQVEINSVEDLMNALNFGSSIRQTDATAINAKSSRSHAVFSLNLVQKKNRLASTQEKRFSVPLEAMSGTETFVTTDSKLHFVDLAGSERLKNTGAQGERAKEGISINAGLAALGKVISQLSSRQPGSHVSYRDSKLTRLLQDSLGGNAITYMIACVTPAEFHLSETLNTVQYAQRARAIQSKPRIQQVEEGDKQAVIDRLKAEVAFLREQIRSAERGGGDRRALAVGERSERQNERENELQNQLLDVQENYSTLSQRHARLIAEMAKARDSEASENQNLESSLGDSATERLNRSNSFAQAVEQVVLEYEKTIQSLEQSLSSTRGSLSNTETTLLEKETKCAYVETINTQLQARLHKLMDREANTENYLHDLEAKLDGHTSGEEKNATIILELRKEIARVRENEAGCEDYISTLEERLAEADQDAELMQREIDRLEQIIERQRSLGKLDSLLYELDNIQDAKSADAEEMSNDVPPRRDGEHSRSLSHVSRHSQRDVLEGVEEEDEGPPADKALVSDVEEGVEEGVEAETPQAETNGLKPAPGKAEFPPPSPAQSRFVADKLETVTQELVDLRVEHETTLNEFDMLHNKYEEALKALADLQDAVDEARHPQRTRDSIVSAASQATRPTSFLSDTRSGDTKDGAHYSSSRSLSSELSSAMESPATVDTSDAETMTATGGSHAVSTEDLAKDDQLLAEVERLKSTVASKDAVEKELMDRYSELEQKHHETLDMVEELKTEVSKARANEATSPRTAQPIIRRKSSQNVMMVDRAHRSFASLRNIANEHFDEQPDVKQNFAINLDAAMHELHARSERIQELEADLASAKKEMETKMTIISGLTRERSSMKASPMDISVVSQMKDQLEQNEKQLVSMREAHEAKEKELTSEMESLRNSLKESAGSKALGEEQTQAVAAKEQRITELQSELASWEGKHQVALGSMESTEKEMKTKIQELEAQVASMNSMLAEAQAKSEDERNEAATQSEAKHQNLVASLRTQIDEYKAVIASNTASIAELETKHSTAATELLALAKARDLAATEAGAHKELLTKLEGQLETLEQARKSHEEGMELLRVNHQKEISDVRAAEQKGYEEQMDVLLTEQAEAVRALESELTDAREELLKVATQVAFALGLDVSVDKITERIDDLIADQKALGEEQSKRGELEANIMELSRINDDVVKDLESIKRELTELLNADGEVIKQQKPVSEHLAKLKKRMADLKDDNSRNSRIVQQLEEQLQTNFDEAQATNNRLSTLAERNAKLEEVSAAKAKMQMELDTIREEYAALQARYDEVLPNADQVKRSNSTNNGLRKSASVTSLPSPPPSVPLPPLPGSAASPTGPSPGTPTHGHRPASKDNSSAANMQQIHDDQEARIASIEKSLKAEKTLNQVLEESLTDLEQKSNKLAQDCESWRQRSQELEKEIKSLRERNVGGGGEERNRYSIMAEEERRKRQEAEAAQRRAEERMAALASKKKKNKASLNCF